MKILIAEDEAVTALMLEAALQKWGHEPMTVHDGDAALAVLSGPEPPPFALLDWMMPGLSGPEVARRVRQMAPPFPPYLILCTSLSGKAQVVAGLDAGANDYVTKPFDIAELHARLRVGLRMVELQQALADANTGLERKVAERTSELTASEQKFRQMAESIEEVFWMTDLEKNVMLYVSPAYERIWGRSCQALYDSPRAWLEAIHPEDRPHVIQAATTLQATGGYDMEYRIVRSDGAERWIHDRAFPVRDADGRMCRVTGLAEDITGRRGTQEALRESEERGRQLLASVTGYGYTVTVRDGKAVEMIHQPGCLAITGYSPQDFASNPALWIEMIPEGDRPAVLAQVAEAGAGRTPPPLEHRLHRRDGALRWVSSTLVPRFGAAHQLAGYDGIITCITARKEAELEMQRALRDLEAVSHGLAHDLRTPLHTITSLVGLLLAEHASELSPEAADHLQRLLAAGRLAHGMGGDFTRHLEQIRHPLEPHRVAMEPLVRAAWEALGPETSRIRLELGPLPVGWADPALLQIVWHHLLGNAVKFSGQRPGAHVTVGGGLEGGQTHYWVRDCGVGFPAQHAEKLFRPFQRLHHRGEFPGTGLGLATVRRLVERHGGRVWAEGETGQGATFHFTLPQAAPAETGNEGRMAS